MREFCLTHGISSAIHLGDIFHSRIAARYECFNPTFRAFQKFRECGITIDFIVGNHDQVRKNGALTTIDIFTEIGSVYKGPTHLTALGAWAVPYTHDFALLRTWLDAIPSEHTVLAHIDVIGAEAGAGWACEWGIELSVLSRFKLVLMGHYHKRQQLLPHVHYIGCATPQDFTELGSPGRFVVWDDSTGEVNHHTNSAARFISWTPGQETETLQGAYVRVEASPSPLLDDEMSRSGALGWNYNPAKIVRTVLQRDAGISLETDMKQVISSYAAVHAGTLPVDNLVAVGRTLFES
jgi:DNA repair exonuclease SbcCD nuclease subunit